VLNITAILSWLDSHVLKNTDVLANSPVLKILHSRAPNSALKGISIPLNSRDWLEKHGLRLNFF
jgi:hypothetical protein